MNERFFPRLQEFLDKIRLVEEGFNGIDELRRLYSQPSILGKKPQNNTPEYNEPNTQGRKDHAYLTGESSVDSTGSS